MLTGLDISRQFDERTDRPFTDFYSPAQKTILFKQAFREAILQKSRVLQTQFRYDELRSLIVRKKRVKATSGLILLQPINILGFNFATQTLTLVGIHNAEVGEQVTINMTGSITSVSGQFTVISVTETTIVVSGVLDIGVFQNGTITTEQSLTDYLHLRGIEASFKKKTKDEIQGFEVNTDKVAFKLVKSSELRNGDKVFISGVLGTTNANGERFVKRIGKKAYQLYLDEGLNNPVQANGFYLGGGDIFKLVTNPCFDKTADQRVDKINEATVNTPYFEMGENAIFVDPSEFLEHVLVDYLKEPPVDIDPTNNQFDYETLYSYEMVNFVIDVAVKLFQLRIRDLNQAGAENQQIIINE